MAVATKAYQFGFVAPNSAHRRSNYQHFISPSREVSGRLSCEESSVNTAHRRRPQGIALACHNISNQQATYNNRNGS
ncbi:hypothetical protein M405DRAFT_814411 [Rhizopogon salebrosus TDB-379]|nr:hypothetical protein M405DRAFT_814411 [Rhizopogon salebrosus TDB-379]